MAEQSAVNNELWLLNDLQDLRDYSVKLARRSKRHIAILSRELDEKIYGADEYLQAITDFVRSSRHCQVQILIKDSTAALASGHPFVRLAQRLPSKIQLRKLIQEPGNKDMGFMLGDTAHLLYQNDDTDYRGFYDSAAAAKVKQLREEYNYLWHYAEAEPEFQQLHL